MLHFFSVSELDGRLRVAGRFKDELRQIRDATTANINSFLRRRLDVEPDIVEYVDAPRLGFGQAFTHYMLKKNVSNLQVAYSRSRAWDDNVLTDDCYTLDAENGKITLFGPAQAQQMGFRLRYDGGWEARSDDAELMACPDNLRYAALDQAVFDGRRSLGMDQGTTNDDDKKSAVRMTGLLLTDVANVFMPFRRTLGN